MLFTSWKLVITITLMWHEGSVMTGEVVGCQEVRLSSQPSGISLLRGLPKPAVFFLSSSRSYWCVPTCPPHLPAHLLLIPSLFLIPPASFPDFRLTGCCHLLLSTNIQARLILPAARVRISTIGIIKHSGWVTDIFAKASSDGKIELLKNFRAHLPGRLIFLLPVGAQYTMLHFNFLGGERKLHSGPAFGMKSVLETIEKWTCVSMIRNLKLK